jgi:hypothetical protein
LLPVPKNFNTMMNHTEERDSTEKREGDEES